MKLEDLQTGDILLFSSSPTNIFFKILDWGIRFFTQSKYNHAAFVLKNPSFIYPSREGIYIWQSSWGWDVQDEKNKLGVEISDLSKMLQNYQGYVYVRKLSTQCGSHDICDKDLSRINAEVYNKPYDLQPIDWLEALNKMDSKPQKLDRFWCSALVAYILVELGFLDKSTDWSKIRPCDLSSQNSLVNKPLYGEDILLKY
jgi:hypothetical protein